MPKGKNKKGNTDNIVTTQNIGLTGIEQKTTIQQHFIFVPDAEWYRINNENNSLKERILILEGNEKRLEEIKISNEKTIDELRKENAELKQKIIELENKIAKMQIKIDQLEEKDKIRDAVYKLHECDALANDTFRNEFKKYFGLSKYDKNVPNLSDFIKNSPEKGEREYDFWQDFLNKFPGSNNKQFQIIYCGINNKRMQMNAHPDISRMLESEFEECFKLVFPDIYMNKTLFNDYKKWLYLF